MILLFLAALPGHFGRETMTILPTAKVEQGLNWTSVLNVSPDSVEINFFKSSLHLSAFVFSLSGGRQDKGQLLT